MDFSHSAKAQDFLQRTQAFMNDKVLPAEEAYYRALSTSADHSEWQQPEIAEELKDRLAVQGSGICFCPVMNGVQVFPMLSMHLLPRPPAGA